MKMPTPCPHCLKNIKKIYIVSRANPLYFKCPHCTKPLKIKNALREIIFGLLAGGIASGIWIFLLKSNIIEYNLWAVVFLFLIFMGGIPLYLLVNIKTHKEIVPTTYQPPVTNMRAIVLGLILLPTLMLTVTTARTYHIYSKATTKGILSYSDNLEKNVNLMLKNLEENKYSEERKTELLKLMAKEGLQYKREYKAFLDLINAFIILIIYIITVLGAGTLLLLKKDKEIRMDYEKIKE